MFRPHVMALALVLFAVIGVQAHAAQYSFAAIIGHPSALPYSPQFYAFLHQYIPQSTINATVYYNQSVGSNTYVIMYFLNSDYLIVNTTGGTYSMVLNNSTAYNVLRPYTTVEYYPNSTTRGNLNAYMTSYQQTASPPIADCLTETGLNRGLTCTEANSCQSCQTVPVCKDFLAAAGGVTSLGGVAIANFSTDYATLNSSYGAYFSALANITPNNTYSSLLFLQNVAQRVSNISTSLPHNPLFPVPQGFSPSNFASCTSYVVGQAPWYCNSFGFCKSLNFNSTTLYSVQALLTSLLSQPISNMSVRGEAINSTKFAFSLLAPEYQKQLSTVIAANYGRYNASTKNASLLLAAFYNASLSSSLSNLQATFLELASFNFRTNASTYNSLLSAQFANLSLIYIPLNAKYSTLKAISTNNTALVLQRELEYQSEPASLASLAYAQQSINNLLASGINSTQYASVYAQLKSVQTGLNAIGSPVSMPALIKAIDGGMVGSILAGSNAPVPSKLSAAPLYVFLISLALAIVIILVIYLLTFRRLSKKRRLHLHPNAKRAWLLLFVVLFVVGIAFSYLTYAYAAGANQFLPIDGFISQVASHSSVFIAFNGTAAAANQSIQQCAASVDQTLNSTHKTVHTLTIVNYTCISSSSAPNCFDQLLASGSPVIVLSQGKVSSVTYKGMYGQVLYASGQAASGSACYVNGVLKVK